MKPAVMLTALLAGAPAIAAPPATGACQYQLLETLPVRYTGPGLSLTIEGRINGTPADMLVIQQYDITGQKALADAARERSAPCRDGAER